jgi:cytochrome c biogenesis protein
VIGSAQKSVYNQLLDVLSNIMFPVVVFIIWAAATTVGTIVDQNQAPETYYQEYPQAVANLILRLHLTNVFHSLPYISLVVLLLVSMSVCTFRRVIPKRFPRDRAVPIENFGLHAAQAAAGTDLHKTGVTVEAFLRRRGFATRSQDIDGARWIFADKQKWARYGVLVAHLGFAVIAFGVFVYWRLGYAGTLQIFRGQTVPVSGSDASVTLRSFVAKFVPVQTPSGIFYQASKFESDLDLRSPERSESATTIVNKPYVSPQHIYFYQASYGYGGNLQVLRAGKVVRLPGTDGRLMSQDGVFLPGTSRAIEYGTLLGPSDPSQVPVGVPVPKADEYAIWVFHDNIPTTDKPILLPVGKTIDVGDGFAVHALPPVPWTGLTYRYDPGQQWVGVGAAILVLGFVMSLFFAPVKLYARLRARAGGVEVAVAATTTKGNAMYEDDFAALVKGLGGALQPPRDAPGRDAVQAYA